MTPVLPVLQALLLADHAYKDAQTNKHIVVGIFNRVFVTKNPPTLNVEHQGQMRPMLIGGMQSGSPYAYFSLTEVNGTIPLELRFVDLDEDKILLHTSLQVAANSKLDTVEGILPLPMLPIPPRRGVYSLELLSNNELLGSVRLVAEEIVIAPPATH